MTLVLCLWPIVGFLSLAPSRPLHRTESDLSEEGLGSEAMDALSDVLDCLPHQANFTMNRKKLAADHQVYAMLSNLKARRDGPQQSARTLLLPRHPLVGRR